DLGHQRIAVRGEADGEVAGVYRTESGEQAVQRPVARATARPARRALVIAVAVPTVVTAIACCACGARPPRGGRLRRGTARAPGGALGASAIAGRRLPGAAIPRSTIAAVGL